MFCLVMVLNYLGALYMSTALVMSCSTDVSFVQNATPGSLIFWIRNITESENPNLQIVHHRRKPKVFLSTLQISSPWNPPATIKSSLTAMVLIWTLDRGCDNNPGCFCRLNYRSYFSWIKMFMHK